MAQGVRNNPILRPTDLDSAYAAGFFDGEAAISVRSRRGHQSVVNGWAKTWYASITVSQVDPAPLYWLKERWGGAVRTMAKPKQPQWSQGYEWCIVGQQFYSCMDDVRQFLKIKHRQADNALRLRTLAGGRGVGITPEGIVIREEIEREAKRLNQARHVAN